MIDHLTTIKDNLTEATTSGHPDAVEALTRAVEALEADLLRLLAIAGGEQ